MLIKDFIKTLERDNQTFLKRRDIQMTVSNNKKAGDFASKILRIWFWNKYLGSQVLGRFMLRIGDSDLGMALGRQVGDEAKHAFYIGKRLRSFNAQTESPLPIQAQFYQKLDRFTFAEQFFAAYSFICLTRSLERQEKILECLDAGTVELFFTHIRNDEIVHNWLTHLGLVYYCITDDARQRAQQAVKRTRDAYAIMLPDINRYLSYE